MQAEAKGCRVRFEPAKESDDEALRALLHKTPMGGSISVAFLREPGYFSATRIQGPFTQVLIAKAGEEIVGAATRAIRHRSASRRPCSATPPTRPSGHRGQKRTARVRRTRSRPACFTVRSSASSRPVQTSWRQPIHAAPHGWMRPAHIGCGTPMRRMRLQPARRSRLCGKTWGTSRSTPPRTT